MSRICDFRVQRHYCLRKKVYEESNQPEDSLREVEKYKGGLQHRVSATATLMDYLKPDHKFNSFP